MTLLKVLKEFDEHTLRLVISIQPISAKALKDLIGKDNVKLLVNAGILDIKASEHLHQIISGKIGRIYPRVYRTTAIAKPALVLKGIAQKDYYEQIAEILIKTLDIIRRKTEDGIVRRELVDKVVSNAMTEISRTAGFWREYILNKEEIEKEIIETAIKMILESKEVLFDPVVLLKYRRFLRPDEELCKLLKSHGKSVEINEKTYFKALIGAIVEYNRRIYGDNFDKWVLSGEWTTVPESPLEQLYDFINAKLGAVLPLGEHVKWCKKLSKLGYVRYSYGGISIVKGKKAEKHWIGVTDYAFRKIKEVLKE